MTNLASIDKPVYTCSIDGVAVNIVTISPKYQVVIPLAIREALRLKPGQKVQAFACGDRIELIPVRSLRSMRGFLRGLATDVPRDEDRV
jgi:AbrB family looped-hinge helix DNA binding protein